MVKSTRSKPTSKTRKPAPLEGNKVWRERGRVRKSSPTLRDKTAWDKLPARWQHVICLGFLLVVALGFFAPTTFGGRTLVGGDTVQWRGTAEAMLQYEVSSNGEEALWSPYVFGGMPGYMIHYPPQTIGLDTIVTGLRAMGLWPVAHVFVLLCGMYLLVFVLTRSELAGVFAAVAFGFTTYLHLLLIAGHNTKFITLAYAPWLLLAVAVILYRPEESKWYRNLLLALLFAIVAAINLRARHPQITYYLVFAVGVWWMAEGVASIRLKKWKRFGLSTSLLFLGSVLALFMAAQPYLAQWEYKAFTIRATGPGGGLAWAYAMAWSQGIKEMITLVVAGAYGGGGQTYWGAKAFTAGPHYFGALTVLLSGFGVFGVARRATAGLGIAAFLMTLFALGEYLPIVNRSMFSFFPLFNSFRVPETWLAAVALIVAVLAGYGLYYLMRREATEGAEERKTRWLYVGFSTALLFLAVVYVGAGSVFDFTKDGEAGQIEMAVAQQLGAAPSDPRVQPAADEYLGTLRGEREALFKRDAIRSLGILALALLLLVLYRRPGMPAWVIAAGFILLIPLDLWGVPRWSLGILVLALVLLIRHRTRGIPSWAIAVGFILLITFDLWGVGRRYFNDESPALRTRRDIAAAITEYDFDRFIQNKVEEAGGPGHFRTLPLALNPMNDGRTPFFYESTGGYHAAKLALYQDYIDRLLMVDEAALNQNALDLMSTRFVVSQAPLPGLEPIYRSEETGLLVLENTDYLPRAFFVDEIEVIAEEQDALTRLRDTTLDLRRTAVLPETLEGYAPAPSDTTSIKTVNLRRFTPRELVWEVETDAPRLMVISEVYYPAGWVVQIDDEDAPIIRANHLLRAVQIPAGSHIVRMAFDPESHRKGLYISFLSTLLVYMGAIALSGWWWYRKGHPA